MIRSSATYNSHRHQISQAYPQDQWAFQEKHLLRCSEVAGALDVRQRQEKYSMLDLQQGYPEALELLEEEVTHCYTVGVQCSLGGSRVLDGLIAWPYLAEL